MAGVKNQVKWVVKHFSSLVLLALVAAAGVAYFTTRLSIAHFTTLVFVVVVAILLLAYYGFMNVRAVLIFAVIAVVLLGGVMLSKRPSVKANQFQAVFLANGSAYFGHLKDIDTPTPTLTDVYLIRNAAQQSTTTQAATPQPVLAKLSSDLHSPEYTMVLRADQIMFWENLQDSGKVVQAIKKDLGKK